jgi:pimeloyl-ACP methyl ester carboxylesterase
VLIGHSIGCQVVAHLAERGPDRAASLVLASPTGDPEAGRTQQSLRLLFDAAREAPALIPVALRDYLRAGPLRMWHTLRLALDDEVAERLERLPHRCLVVRGSDDDVVTAEWAQVVAAAVRAEQAVTIPDAPHGLPFTAPSELAGAISRFVAGPRRHLSGDKSGIP